MRKLDRKFSIDGERIVNTVSGEEIPLDEPLFLLRARDVLALRALVDYRDQAVAKGCDATHIWSVSATFNDFLTFATSHPERMKQPGITRHIQVEPSPQASLAIDQWRVGLIATVAGHVYEACIAVNGNTEMVAVEAARIVDAVIASEQKREVSRG